MFSSFIVLAVILDPALVAKISASAVVVGTLGTVAQALLQKPWWNPKIKWALSWAWAIVGGLAAYIVLVGVPTEISVSNIQAIFAFVVGAYASIRIAYEALKKPVVEKLEQDAGLGGGETPPGQLDPNELEDTDFRSQVPDPYPPNRQDPLV